MGQNMETEGNRTGVATNKVEAVVALILFILGAVVVYNAVQLGHRWESDGPGPGYFPFYIGLIIVISSAVVFFQALIGKNKNTEIFVDTEQLKRVLQILIPAMIFVGGIQVFGIYVASFVYITLFMILLGKNSPVKSAIIAFCVNALFFMMFEVWFKVPLFKGQIDLLSFLGY
jgi:hypothetical protein